jgi:hypothetical protein
MSIPDGGTELRDIQAANFLLACYAISNGGYQEGTCAAEETEYLWQIIGVRFAVCSNV